MNEKLIQGNVLEAIKKKVPDKVTLATMLADLLCMEKGAVYRRLRGEVSFTFFEITLISNALGISIDNIISSTLSIQSRPFQLQLVNYYNPADPDYMMTQQYLDILREGKDDPRSELIDCTNILPPVLYGGYKGIEKFHLFKWMYQSGNTNTFNRFKCAEYTDRMRKMIRENLFLTKQIKTSIYIFDPFVFQYIVNDINYFSNIDMIEADDRLQLKEELLCFINDLEQLAVRGAYKDTGNAVSLYVGSVNFNLSYWCVDINGHHISLMKAFVLNNFSSPDEQSYSILKTRISALLRSSTMISVSGEKQRKLFFDEQRTIIKTL